MPLQYYYLLFFCIRTESICMLCSACIGIQLHVTVSTCVLQIMFDLILFCNTMDFMWYYIGIHCIDISSFQTMTLPLLVNLMTQISNPVLMWSTPIKLTHYLHSQQPFLKSQRKISVRLKLTGSPCMHTKSILAFVIFSFKSFGPPEDH